MDRDLAHVDLWEESLRRSRDRRERAAAQPAFELPARGLSVTAMIAVAGVPVTAVAAGKALTGSDQPTAVTKAASQRVSAERAVGAAVDRAAGINEPAKPKPKPARPKATTSTAGAAEIAAPAKPAAGTATVKPAAVESRPVARAAQSGGGVVALQRKLGVTADGDFGPATERALKRWQRRHGLTADGIAGPQTRTALGLGSGKVLERKHASRKQNASKRPMARRASNAGGGVRGLQAALGIGVDGVFGPGTERALKRWQRAHGLTADGVAGPQTRAALGLGPGKVLKRRGSGGGSSGGGGGVGSSTVEGVIAAANRIATSPYKYGGGHGSFTDSGYDCSGSVSYALHGGGLLSSPIDSGAFMSYGAPGPGKRITIYANPGHVYMTIDGRRYDTSARSESGSRWTGTQRSTAGYTVRHPPGL